MHEFQVTVCVCIEYQTIVFIVSGPSNPATHTPETLT